MFTCVVIIGAILIGLSVVLFRLPSFVATSNELKPFLNVCGIICLLVGCVFFSAVVTPSDEISLYDSTPVQGVTWNNSTVYYGDAFITKDGILMNKGEICVILIEDGVWFARGLPPANTTIIEVAGMPIVRIYECYWDVSLFFGLLPSIKIPSDKCVYELCIPKNSGNEVIPYLNDDYRLRDPIKYVPYGSYLIGELF